MSDTLVNEMVPAAAEQVVEKVRERYGKIGDGSASGCGCGVACAGGEETLARGLGYSDAELAALPEEANLGLGCGAPLAHLGLAPGETVVDLGSGGGIDAFLAAQQVGDSGRVIGVDMTPEMIDRARAAAARHGIANVEFRQGRLEALPVESATVDAVTSNCVINLVPDKSAVFREVARVLKPGGRLVVSDIVLERELPGPLARDLMAWVGCVAGAELRSTYFARLADAGLGEVEIVRDIDYAAALQKMAPEEAAALLGRFGLSFEEISGSVRSVTYRATKLVAGSAPAACCGPSCCSN